MASLMVSFFEDSSLWLVRKKLFAPLSKNSAVCGAKQALIVRGLKITRIAKKKPLKKIKYF